MKLKLTDCSKEKFIEYALERKRKGLNDNKYGYSYITKQRLEKVFDYMCKRKTTCEGNRYYISDVDGFISQFTESEVEKKEFMEECLFHEVWCKCEWIYRIIDKEREFYESLKGYIGIKTLKEMEII